MSTDVIHSPSPMLRSAAACFHVPGVTGYESFATIPLHNPIDAIEFLRVFVTLYRGGSAFTIRAGRS